MAGQTKHADYLEQALASLTPTDRVAVRLIYFDHYSYREASAALKLTPTELNAALMRAYHVVAAVYGATSTAPHQC